MFDLVLNTPLLSPLLEPIQTKLFKINSWLLIETVQFQGERFMEKIAN